MVTETTTQSGKHLVVINYLRPGINTQERVRQYSYPMDRSLYRVTCASMASQFSKYEPTCAAVIESLKAGEELK